MDIKNLILIIIAILNFLIGLFILFKNTKKTVNITFAFLLIGASLWSIGLAFSREYAGTVAALNWSRSTYFTSLFIGFDLLIFSLVFPYSIRLNQVKKFLLIAPFVILTAIMAFNSNFIIKEMTVMPWGYDNLYSGGYLIYSIVLLYYFILSFINFIHRYLKSEGVIKKQLALIILGLGVASIFGIIFDLILPYFGNWKLNWLGPYFTIFVLFSISYLIFYKSNKQY